jgi:UDP-GlcNAc:undecaprenyl-phosphate GlcNAc-1-phosphate transferase
VAWAIVRRRASFGTADRGHLHHRLLDMGLGHRSIVALYYIPAIIFGLASVFLHDWRHKAVLLLVVVLAGTAAMARLARTSRKPVLSGK